MIWLTYIIKWAFLVPKKTVKNLPAMQETWVQSPGKEDPWEKRMATQFIILAWRISLAGYSPWGCQELDTTEWLTYIMKWSSQEIQWPFIFTWRNEI